MSQSKMTRALHKLARMSSHELLFRLREKAWSELERSGLYRTQVAAPDDFKGYLASCCADRFYPAHRRCSLDAAAKSFPSWMGRAASAGNKLCSHHVDQLRLGSIQLGNPIDWHRDPVTGQTWEVRFWRDYDPENDPGRRDAKIIHELNRHQHLPRLAKAYAWTGDEKFANEAVAQLRGWIAQNPPGFGINWQSSLEIAIRGMSWLWTIFLLLPSRSFSPAAAQQIGDSLLSQLEHVHSYTSLYSSANTHLIGEAAALLIAGLVFRDLPCAQNWMEHGRSLLRQEAEKQILDDGVYGELSSYYHCYALDFYLQAAILAEHNHLPLGARVEEKIRGMLDFLLFLTRPDGTIPLLGDDDGGRALALANTSYRSSRDLLCLGALFLGRADCKHQAGELSEEAFWLHGPAALRDYDRLGSEPPAATSRLFAHAGYAIHRSGWGDEDSHLVFDCGGLGILNGGHAHADALSVTLFSHARELLADPGTFVYNCAPEWRNYFRSTRAHNTATIHEQDQAEQGTTFRWNTRMATRIRKSESGEIEFIEAEHDGYQRLSGSVTHRRRLLYIPGEYWVMVDDLRAGGSAQPGPLLGMELNFHLGRDVDISSLRQTDTSVVLRSDPSSFLLAVFGSQSLVWRQWRGETAPIAGWWSDGHGHKQPAWALRASMGGPGPTAAITVMHPACGSSHVEQVDAGSALACVVEHGDFRDIVILPATGDQVTVANFQVRGDLFWIRTRSGQVVRQASWPASATARPDSRQLAKDGCPSKEAACAGLVGS